MKLFIFFILVVSPLLSAERVDAIMVANLLSLDTKDDLSSCGVYKILKSKEEFMEFSTSVNGGYGDLFDLSLVVMRRIYSLAGANPDYIMVERFVYLGFTNCYGPSRDCNLYLNFPSESSDTYVLGFQLTSDRRAKIKGRFDSVFPIMDVDVARIESISTSWFMPYSELNKLKEIFQIKKQATEPNQALQRTNMLVTDRAPSSTLRAKHVRR